MCCASWPRLPGYMYAQGADGLYVNLYAAGTAEITLPNGKPLQIVQKTRYPWDGRIDLTLNLKSPGLELALMLRIPRLVRRGQGGGQRQADFAGDGARLRVRQAGLAAGRHARAGAAHLPVESLEAHPLVKADLGRVALQRGPVVYCVEAADNGRGAAQRVPGARNRSSPCASKPTCWAA